MQDSKRGIPEETVT